MRPGRRLYPSPTGGARSSPDMSPRPNGGNGNGSIATWIAVGGAIIGLTAFIINLVNPRDLAPREDLRALEMRLTERETQDNRRTADAQRELKESIAQIGRNLSNFVSEKEINEFYKRFNEVHADLKSRVDYLQANIVPRSEHDRQWTEERERVSTAVAQITDRISAVRDVVQDLQRQFNGSYNVGKQLENLQGQLTDMQHRIDAVSRTYSTPTTPNK